MKETDQNFTVDRYLKLCEQLGNEPNPQKMPLTQSDFPAEVQVAFFILSFLSDVWDGMSGMYMGKNWAPIAALLDAHEIEDRQTILFLMKTYENTLVNFRAEKEAKKKKPKEASSGGKVTHSVQG